VWRVAATILCLVYAADAGAIGLEYRNPEERVHGIDAAVFHRLAHRNKSRYGFAAEVGERRPFNVPGLVARYARAGMQGRRLYAAVSAVALSSGVGGEDLLQAEVIYNGESNILIGVSAGIHSVRIDGFQPTFLATVSTQVAARIKRLLVGYSARSIRLAGEALDGADGSLYAAFAGGRFVPVSRFDITRDGFWSISASLRVEVGSYAGLSIGYLGGTGAIAGAGRVRVRRVGVAVEVSSHPVLGLSESLFVTWGVW